eukprot:766934-Hanusia_phi.AAC.2
MKYPSRRKWCLQSFPLRSCTPPSSTSPVALYPDQTLLASLLSSCCTDSPLTPLSSSTGMEWMNRMRSCWTNS